MMPFKILHAGERAVIVEFGNAIDPVINSRVNALSEILAVRPVRGVLETVPSYRSLMICYNPASISPFMLRLALLRRIYSLNSAETNKASARRILVVPVCYGGEFGADLSDVAAHTGLSEDEVVRRHSAAMYRVYMLGFLPGFAYLGGLDTSIETPRLKTPRPLIPKGSVGIGGKQTGIYPLDSPGGWRLIGQTPLLPYDQNRSKPVLYKAGDMLRFNPIGQKEFDRIRTLADKGLYKPVWENSEYNGGFEAIKGKENAG